MNVNKVLLTGRLTADPETRQTTGGQSVTTVRLATSRTWNDQVKGKQEQTEFHTIILWGKLGEISQKYLTKGQLAFFEGRLQTRNWQDQTGNKRYTTEIIAENMQMGPRPNGAPSGGGSFNRPASLASSAPTGISTPSPTNKKPASGSDDDDIPVINEDYPVADPMKPTGDVEEAEIDLKDIPF